MSIEHNHRTLNPKPRTPIRSCVGCGAKRPQREMLRIAARDGAVPVLDQEKRAAGRGAYLCRTQTCLERALARRALERSLKLKQTVPAALRSALERAINKLNDTSE